MMAEHRIIFSDREDAGVQLAMLLQKEYQDKNVLVLGIPRGGVEIAYHVARLLHGEMNVVISKKLSYPGHEEFGFGAISEEGHIFVPERKQLLTPDMIDRIIEKQEIEIRRRVDLYRSGRPLPSLEKRTVILVDDGIATGVTLVPAIRLCRKKGAAKIIVAAPVAGRNYNEHIREADEIRIITQPSEFYGVSQAYIDFGQLSDERVLALIRQAELEGEMKL
jgi:putative phosphoribosyl transferase